ncbi:MAG: right-handed parallel beta-helix repeat-containing protein [Anaerolineales bacterium]|nr:right-handed parallel beta-helix repeat-containing protein [Anaerolineales bacterium]
MKKIMPLLLVFMAILVISGGNSPAAAQISNTITQGGVYYVAPTGDDDNPGTLASPWQTIQKAAETLGAGDTVYIRAGTYSEQVVAQHSGSPGNPITFAAYPGETATLDGSSVTLPDDLAGLFEIASQSYIRVSGLRVIHAGPYNDNAGILVMDSSDIVIENVSTDQTQSSGIGVWGSQRVTIQGNRIEWAGLSGWQECITVAGTDDFVVRDNVVLNCQKEGICLKDGDSNGQAYDNQVNGSKRNAIYVDAWDKYTHDIDVYQNLVHHSIEGAGLAVASEQGGQLSNIRLYNNVAYQNNTYGIEISYCCTDSHPMDTILLINNTLYDNGNEVDWGGGIIADNPQAENVTIRNNITSQNLTFQIAVAANVPAANVTVDHNLIDGYRGYEDEVYGEDYVEGDPMFVNPGGANFHLQAGSPAVDAGWDVEAPALDFEGDFRPQDGDEDGTAIHDIGADEVRGDTMQVYLPIVVKD